jgi:hypothetical protein
MFPPEKYLFDLPCLLACPWLEQMLGLSIEEHKARANKRVSEHARVQYFESVLLTDLKHAAHDLDLLLQSNTKKPKSGAVSGAVSVLQARPRRRQRRRRGRGQARLSNLHVSVWFVGGSCGSEKVEDLLAPIMGCFGASAAQKKKAKTDRGIVNALKDVIKNSCRELQLLQPATSHSNQHR